MGFVKEKVRIGSGVTLTVHHVVVGDFRRDVLTQAPGFDLAAPSLDGRNPGVLLHNETAVIYSVCLPKPIWSQGLSTSTRAASRPGPQLFNLSQPQPGCINVTGTTASVATLARYPPRAGLALQPRLPDRCWADCGVFVDFAIPGADLTNRGASTTPNNYTVVLVNVSYVCSSVIPMDCYPGLFACALALTATISKNNTAKLPWQLPAGPDAELVVRSGRELAVALAAAPLVTSVVVAQDLWMREADWEGLLLPGAGNGNGSSSSCCDPVLLSRNITVAGAPGLASWPLVNLGFVHRKIRIASGVVLTAHHLLVGDFRNEIATQQGAGFDLVAPTLLNAYDKNSGLLIHVETTLLYGVCLPASIWNASILSAPRARSRPGSQSFQLSLPQEGCVITPAAAAAAAAAASAAPSSSSSGLLQPPLMSRCWADRGTFMDFASPGADVNTFEKQVQTWYDVLLQNVSYLCADVMSWPCIQERGGPLGCMTWMTLRLAAGALPWQDPATAAAAPPAAAWPESGRGVDSQTVKAAAIGGAVGGAVLLALLAAAALLFVRRRRRLARERRDGLQFSSLPSKAGPNEASDGSAPLDPWKSGSTGSTCLPRVFFAASGAAAGKAAPARVTPTVSGEGRTVSDSAAAGEGGGGEGSASATPSGTGTGTGTGGEEESGGAGLVAVAAGAAAAPGSSLASRDARDAAGPSAAAAEGPRSSGRGGGSAVGSLGHGGSAGPGVISGPISSSDGPTGDALTRSGDPSTSRGSQPRPQASAAALQQLMEDEHMVVTPLTPPRADLALGEAAAQEVTLLPVVRGKGAFGRVYEGLYGGEKVAVKVMRDVGDLGAGGGGAIDHVRNSFAQEVEVLGRCQHPNVVRLLAACLTPPKLLLVMELMETSLEKLVYSKTGGLMPLRTVLYIALDVAKGLEYLHPTVLHRDLKPGNVLINGANTPRPVAKLTDFGVSRLRSTVLITKHPEAGTPAYMAPETFDVKNYTLSHHVDIYSFGVLLWVLLTGEHPWRGFQMVEVAYKVTINRERLPTARILPSRCPLRLRALMDQCWEYEPRRRPAAAEVVKELQSLLDSLT